MHKLIIKSKVLPSFISEIVDTKEKAISVVKEIKEKGILSIKTIGSSTDSLKAQIVGVFYTGGTAYYIPVGHNEFMTRQISFEDFKEIFEQILDSDKIKNRT